MRLYERLTEIGKLRAIAEQQTADFAAGKGEAPKMKPATFDLMEKMVRNLHGDYSMGRANIKETLTTTDTVRLIPKVIEGQLREAAEPVYLATNYMSLVHVEGGSSAVYVIPIVGELTASEVSEGGRYNEGAVDFNTLENSALEVRVKKIGLKVSITEEAITDSSWDILGINIKKMGRAMARYKEEWIFNNFSDHGHICFDNAMRTQMPEAGTQGRAADGSFNDTMSVEDFLDLVLALMGNGFTPSNVIMHPLTWVVFARNSMIGNGLTFGAFGGNNVHPWGQVQGTPGFAGLAANGDGQKLIMKPEQVQNRLPVPLQIDFSPFVKFDKVNKRFDMYCVDNSEVGVIVQKEGLSQDDWNDPERDIRLLKVKERYGVGISNNGRAITVARNLAVAPTYPVPPTVVVQQTP
jgi:hypothetical protein